MPLKQYNAVKKKKNQNYIESCLHLLVLFARILQFASKIITTLPHVFENK